jgi:hypothetical protein
MDAIVKQQLLVIDAAGIEHRARRPQGDEQLPHLTGSRSNRRVARDDPDAQLLRSWAWRLDADQGIERPGFSSRLRN